MDILSTACLIGPALMNGLQAPGLIRSCLTGLSATRLICLHLYGLLDYLSTTCLIGPGLMDGLLVIRLT